MSVQLYVNIYTYIYIYIYSYLYTMSVYVYVYMSLRGGRSPKVSLGFTCVVVCLGFIEDCFRVYLGLVYWIFFRAYFGLVQLIVMLFVFF